MLFTVIRENNQSKRKEIAELLQKQPFAEALQNSCS